MPLKNHIKPPKPVSTEVRVKQLDPAAEAFRKLIKTNIHWINLSEEAVEKYAVALHEFVAHK